MKIFCHNDNDGHSSGAVVWLETGKENKAKIYEMDYIKPFPIEDIEENEKVFILDYSLQPDMMKQLMSVTKDIVWIDHHKSAIAKYDNFEGLDGLTDVVLDTNHSGCVLTWKYFHTDIPLPRILELIEDWDIWKHEFKPDNEYVALALDSYDMPPDSDLWAGLILNGDGLIPSLIKQGEVISRYLSQHNKEVIQGFGHEVEFEGRRCIAVNKVRGSSKLFDSVWGEYPMYLTYAHTGDKYTVSVYSDGDVLDVSHICRKYGGGGHPGAGGFTIDKLPFKRTGPLPDRVVL